MELKNEIVLNFNFRKWKTNFKQNLLIDFKIQTSFFYDEQNKVIFDYFSRVVAGMFEKIYEFLDKLASFL